MIPDQVAPAFAAVPAAAEIRGPSALNPLAAWPRAISVVVPDPARASAFYARHCGYTVSGAGAARLERLGAPDIRLVRGPPGAAPIRGAGGATPVDPGFAALRCVTADIACTRAELLADDVGEVAEPQSYAFGPEQRPWASGLLLAVDGPAGERILFDQPFRPDALREPPTKADERTAAVTPILFGFDRWPWLDGIAAALRLRPWMDRFAGQPGLARVAGLPEGGQFRILALGGLEYWEFRSFRPPATPPWPTCLDRTGLAMLTMACVDPAGTQQRLAEAGVAGLDIASDGTPRLRGAVGELIEIVGRDA